MTNATLMIWVFASTLVAIFLKTSRFEPRLLTDCERTIESDEAARFVSPLPRRACFLPRSLSSAATAWYCHGERLSATALSTQRTPTTYRKARSGPTLMKTPENITTPPIVR